MHYTMPMKNRFDEFTAIKLVIVVIVMHFKVVELKLFLGHFPNIGRVYDSLQMFFNVPLKETKN